MSIDPEKLAALQAIVGDGTKKISKCKVLKVEWADDAISYYGKSAYDQITPFREIPLRPIEARLLGEDPLSELEINGDINTPNVELIFDDIDKDITDKFHTYGGGRKCSIFYYYPQVDLAEEVWWGQLAAPEIFGWKQIQTVATNGSRSRELLVPGRMRPKECTAIFGGRLFTLDAIATNGCPYDKHLGGSVGKLDPETGELFTDCPRLTLADCLARIDPAPGPAFLGFNTDASAVLTDAGTGFLAVSKSNASSLKTPIRVLAGKKHIRGLNLLQWRREANASNPDHGFVDTIWELGEGPMPQITNFKVNGDTIPLMHLAIRFGVRLQSPTPYAPNISNYSSTVHVEARKGWLNPANITASSLDAEADCTGYDKVRVYTDVDTSNRIWSEDRAWWILELHTNQKFGLGYDHERFDIPAFLALSEWFEQNVRFTRVSAGGEPVNYDGPRSLFDAYLDGRPAGEQFTDICRSGRCSIFQHEGKYTAVAFKALTDEELADVKVFTDTGDGRNIVWDEGMPSINLHQTTPDKLVNEVVITFEDSEFLDTARPLRIPDDDQKARAGEYLGSNNFQTVPKEFVAYGVRREKEAVTLGHYFLYFGEFDSGGTKNNLGGDYMVPFEWTLGMKRYDVIELRSSSLNGFLSPEGNQFKYFRVLKIGKIGNGRARLAVQAYNEVAYADFEVSFDANNTGATVFGDDFNDNELDTEKWSLDEATGFTEQSEQLWVTNSTSSYLRSVDKFPFTGKAMSCEFVLAPTAAATTDMQLAVAASDAFDSLYAITVKGSNLKCIANGVEVFSVAYNSTNHRWVRIRFDVDIGGSGEFTYIVSYQVGANSSTWTEIHSEIAEVGEMHLYLRLINTSVGSRSAKFDNVTVNTTPIVFTPQFPAPLGDPRRSELSSVSYSNGLLGAEIST